MNYDILELRNLALGVISKYTEETKSNLLNDHSFWDDLTIDDHDMTMIIMDILEEVESDIDINSDTLIPLIEADTIAEFLHSLYAIDL